ncbi:acyl-CoA ligase (AMP-forming), exosortase A system-associated [Denitromonas iodatirespirans]|uniref:Acyl-CoA ligase (AMP-forming), exosortase A system-associated n=1 Tax=Denitromonas iodatirespirans TaxID=2795389 RepID=A0A944D8K1_DENI1|nr:acyl-CoA ligase (AMP-forming), exosortase A system-associated [Denitromonas iodatirespirans]MBT0960582.1 acyl-CoA ligase (AMP-forming), exosortase A system-associated [Denitromonas iodatirespirans]
MASLIHELITQSATQTPDATALRAGDRSWSYVQLADEVQRTAALYAQLGLSGGERVAVWLDKRAETVFALFGASRAGGVFVPVNPLLKPAQVEYILKDCNVRVLVTSAERLALLQEVLPRCHDLRQVVVTGDTVAAPVDPLRIVRWADRPEAAAPAVDAIDADMAAILYTSGSTGRPKGVVLSHRNLVAGAASVSSYLENTADDRILAVLPLSFDYGLNQLTTAFQVGACAVLMNYLMPRDIVRMVQRERITGLAAVPPLWVQLAQLDWPPEVGAHLRYITNSGGHMPANVLAALRARLPTMKPYLMYGLTEAFRSTYLPPAELDRRPGSMGKAIPNAQVLVVREDGTECEPGEPGELVHRGVHVSLGYWNDLEKTAERFRPAPGQPAGLPMAEIAVWSGDTVKRDEEGFLYFVGRRDEMIKTSGYRVSPTEVEEVVYTTEAAAEAAAIGVPHPVLGQAIVLVVFTPAAPAHAPETILATCRERLPGFMVPVRVLVHETPLPRNPNGKIDRKQLGEVYAALFDGA